MLGLNSCITWEPEQHSELNLLSVGATLSMPPYCTYDKGYNLRSAIVRKLQSFKDGGFCTMIPLLRIVNVFRFSIVRPFMCKMLPIQYYRQGCGTHSLYVTSRNALRKEVTIYFPSNQSDKAVYPAPSAIALFKLQLFQQTSEIPSYSHIVGFGCKSKI